jgi:hypothetical protein
MKSYGFTVSASWKDGEFEEGTIEIHEDEFETSNEYTTDEEFTDAVAKFITDPNAAFDELRKLKAIE